ncbi:hypothetical protein ACA910_016361 [Epithemia clementina (nom. ined.)]
MRPSPFNLIKVQQGISWPAIGGQRQFSRQQHYLTCHRLLSSKPSSLPTTATLSGQLQQKQQQCRPLSTSVLYDEPVAEPHLTTSTMTEPGSGSRRRPLYVSATRQHVGKTTTSLALVAGLQKRVGKVGFMKPVGQKSLRVREDVGDENEIGQEVSCDKDAVLVKKHFGLDHLRYQDMSPVLIPKGYTKDYVDGKISQNQQQSQVLNSYHRIAQASNVVVCEGTGHVAVGSCVDASNAQVAAWLGARMVLVANGGLGHALDELELNRVFCQKYNVEIAGVIINKVMPDKYEQTKHYLTKALRERWGPDIPLLGLIPDRPFLGCPAIADLEKMLQGSQLISGQAHRYRHFTIQRDLNLVATSLEVFLGNVHTRDGNRTLYVSHASRHEILLGFLMEAQRLQRQQPSKQWESAMIVTGCEDYTPCTQVLEMVKQFGDSPPVLLALQSTAKVLEEWHNYTPKLYVEDGHRVDTAILHYQDYIDFDLLLERTLDDNGNNNNDDDDVKTIMQQ